MPCFRPLAVWNDKNLLIHVEGIRDMVKDFFSGNMKQTFIILLLVAA